MIEERNEFLRRPKWRTRTTPGRRTVAALTTFAALVAVGATLLLAAMWTLRALGAPGWVVALPWIAPTLTLLAWNQHRPGAAIPGDDDDESWIGFAVRLVLVGAGEPRSRLARAAAALVFGAPVGWTFLLLVVLALTGLG